MCPTRNNVELCKVCFYPLLKLMLLLTPTVAAPWLRRLVTGFPSRRPAFESKSGHVGFMVDKVAPEQVFSEYFGFLCQFSFHRLLHTHHLSSGAGTIGQLVADVPSGLSLTPPPQGTKKKSELLWLSSSSPYLLMQYRWNCTSSSRHETWCL
jgi:hypothetical protein